MKRTEAKIGARRFGKGTENFYDGETESWNHRIWIPYTVGNDPYAADEAVSFW